MFPVIAYISKRLDINMIVSVSYHSTGSRHSTFGPTYHTNKYIGSRYSTLGPTYHTNKYIRLTTILKMVSFYAMRFVEKLRSSSYGTHHAAPIYLEHTVRNGILFVVLARSFVPNWVGFGALVKSNRSCMSLPGLSSTRFSASATSTITNNGGADIRKPDRIEFIKEAQHQGVQFDRAYIVERVCLQTGTNRKFPRHARG